MTRALVCSVVLQFLFRFVSALGRKSFFGGFWYLKNAKKRIQEAEAAMEAAGSESGVPGIDDPGGGNTDGLSTFGVAPFPVVK